MIIFALALALLDVFVISQLSFWGVTPLLLAVLIYSVRYEATLVEIVAAASLFAFVQSVFVSPNRGVYVMIASVVATVCSVMLLRTIGQSRRRIQFRGYDGGLMALSFTLIYWAVFATAHLDAFSWMRFSLFVVWSSAFNLVLMMTSDLVFRKLAR